MIVLVGESGSGKTTIRDKIVSSSNFTKAISCTTRNKREHEIEGDDYCFLTKEDFQDKINNDYFLEYAEYNENYYGVPINQIQEYKVAVVEPQGVEQLTKKFGQQIVVFYLQASENTRRNRMLMRGDSLEKIEQRITLDKERFRNIKDYIDRKINTEEDSIEEIVDKIRIAYPVLLLSKSNRTEE
jgi:guanylate kinase